MKSDEIMSVQEFEEILLSISDMETTQDPDGWTEDNPLWGHCAVVSLLAQKLFGGELLRASLEGTPYEKGKSHYINKIDGKNKDFTAAQFTQGYPEELVFEPRERSYVLSYPETVKRYTKLTLRLAEHAYGENPLFQDDIYQRCIVQALSSPCQKMGFGSVIVHNEEVVVEATNDYIEGLKHLCNPRCVRLGLQSRTESMLGACGHAEEWAMKKARDKGIPLTESDLYVAGVLCNGMPWIKEEAVHTCLRCAVQMYYADLKNIFVPVRDQWIGISTQDALKSSSDYAMQIKKI